MIAPADSKAMVAPLKKAMDAGIVVVNFDVALDEEAKKAAGVELAFVGPDNRGGAKLAGDALGKALGKGGKVVIIEGNPGADNAAQRKAGFETRLQNMALSFWTAAPRIGKPKSEHRLLEHADRQSDIQGVMAANDSMPSASSGAGGGSRTDILVVGFDNIPAAQDLVAQGKLLGDGRPVRLDDGCECHRQGNRGREGRARLEGWVKTRSIW